MERDIMLPIKAAAILLLTVRSISPSWTQALGEDDVATRCGNRAEAVFWLYLLNVAVIAVVLLLAARGCRCRGPMGGLRHESGGRHLPARG